MSSDPISKATASAHAMATATQQQQQLSLMETLKKYSPLALFIYIVVILYIISTDANALDKKYYQYTGLLITPIIIMTILGTNTFSDISTSTKQYIFASASFFGLLAIYFYFIQTDRTTIKMLNIGMFIIFFLIVLSSLSVVYTFFMRFIKNSTGWFSILLEFIFILPCYFIELLVYIKTELGSTHPTILILFFIQIIAILLYLYIPKAINYIMSSDKTLIMKEAISLSAPTTVLEYGMDDTATKQYEKVLKYVDGDGNKINYASYSISFWLYLNVDNGGTQDKTIFLYGNPASQGGASGGKPRVVYKNTKENVDELVVYLAPALNSPKLEFSVPSQKWNHVVITYNSGGICDLWVNGNLEQTVRVQNVEYSNADKIIVGDTAGKFGYIKWLKFSNSVFSKRKIMTEYNLGF